MTKSPRRFARDAVPRIRYGYEIQGERDEYKINCTTSSRSFQTNSSGAAILELCDDRKSVGEIVSALASRYHMDDAESLEEDVHFALADFRHKGLITLSGIDDLEFELIRDFKNAVQHNDDPQIVTVDNLLNLDECRHLITLAKDRLRPSRIIGNSELVQFQARASESSFINPNTENGCSEILDKIVDTVRIPATYAELFQVNHYGIGGEYVTHYDSFDMLNVDKPAMQSKKGQRLLTVLIYLNDVIAGGETEFPRLGITVEPKIGRALIFCNCQPESTARHPFSVHRSLPVRRGEKWVVNAWFWNCPVE